jgi:hypothetical protein
VAGQTTTYRHGADNQRKLRVLPDRTDVSLHGDGNQIAERVHAAGGAAEALGPGLRLSGQSRGRGVVATVGAAMECLILFLLGYSDLRPAES